jgi:hypothetical protein
VLDDFTGPGASIGEQVHRAVRFGHVVERDPAGEVRLMSVGDEAGVLVPAELHPALGGLHDVLLVEQVDGVAERRLGDLRHQLREQEPAHRGARPVGVNEVAATAVVEVERIHAEPIHLAVALVDEPLTFAAQRLEIAGAQDGLEHEEAFVAESADVFVRDAWDREVLAVRCVRLSSDGSPHCSNSEACPQRRPPCVDLR